MEPVAILVQVGEILFLHMGAFDLLGGLVALRGLYPVADPAHVDLGGRCALAGMETLGVEDDVELAFEFDDIALAERAGDDFHECGSSIVLRRDRPQMPGRGGSPRSRGATY